MRHIESMKTDTPTEEFLRDKINEEIETLGTLLLKIKETNKKEKLTIKELRDIERGYLVLGVLADSILMRRKQLAGLFLFRETKKDLKGIQEGMKDIMKEGGKQ